MRPQAKALFTNGPVGPLLIQKTLAILIGMLGMIAFNLTDTYFVSLLGTTELAAIGFTFPVVLSVMALAIGLGVGASTLISKVIGQEDWKKAQALTRDSLILSTLVVILFLILGFSFLDEIFQLMGATSLTLPLIKEYMIPWFLGMLFLVIPMVGNGCIRATGDMKTPSIIMLVSMLVNLILDPILIFGYGPIPAMGLQGAAIATVFARMITAVLAVYILIFKLNLITFEKPKLAELKRSFREILHIALPNGASNLIVPFGTAAITKLVSLYGPAAVAAFGVASKIDMVALTITMALGSVLGPFTGQNWGAKLFERVEKGIRFSFIFSLLWGFVMVFICILAAQNIAEIFSQDQEVIKIISNYLWIIPWGYGCHALLALTNAPLYVLERPLWASSLTFTHIFILYIPLAWVGSHYYQLQGIFWSSLVAKVASGLMAVLILKNIYNIEKQKVLN